MVRINWTFQAKDDLRNIANYISRDSKKYAKLQVLRIRNRTQILHAQIQAGQIVPEFEDKNIRELVEGSYRIIYHVVSNTRVDILTVHHAARNLSQRKF